MTNNELTFKTERTIDGIRYVEVSEVEEILNNQVRLSDAMKQVQEALGKLTLSTKDLSSVFKG